MTVTLEKASLERDLTLLMGRAIHLSAPGIALLNPDSLKRAYRLRAHEYHPDKAISRCLDPEYLADRFMALQNAYLRILSNWESGVFVRIAAQTRNATQPRNAAQSWNATRTVDTGRKRDPVRSSPASLRIFHSGGVPRVKLRFAQFLYYSRRIDWETLIKSLSWQFRTRPKLGELGAELGYLDTDAVLDVLRRKLFGEPFGSAALRLGYLDSYRLSVMLGRQRLLGLPIGRYFVENGHIPASELGPSLDSLARHNLALAAERRRRDSS